MGHKAPHGIPLSMFIGNTGRTGSSGGLPSVIVVNDGPRRKLSRSMKKRLRRRSVRERDILCAMRTEVEGKVVSENAVRAFKRRFKHMFTDHKCKDITGEPRG